MKGERQVAGLYCSQVLQDLSDYLDAQLAPENCRQIDAHLAGCDVCARFGGEFGAVVQAVHNHARPALPSAVAARVQAALAAAVAGEKV